jgi:hypothetical protein
MGELSAPDVLGDVGDNVKDKQGDGDGEDTIAQGDDAITTVG